MLTDEYTLKKMCIHAVYVRKVFLPSVDVHVTRIFTLIHTSAQNVANVLEVVIT